MRYTPLYDTHKRLGARFMEFGGFDMPLQYTGIIDEHLTVRSKAGIFDVSHMGEIFIDGKDAQSFCEWLTPNHIASLQSGHAHYSFLLNENGGVIDDLIIYRLAGDSFMFCVNASNTDKDYAWIMQHKQGSVTITNRSPEMGLIAVQGPLSGKIMQAIFPAIKVSGKAPGRSPDEYIKRFTFVVCDFKGRQVYVSRTGYTGEDGYECFVDNSAVVELWDTIMDSGKAYGIKPVGLGARDTLRAEMGYPLYGMELNGDMTPLSANLGWVIKMDKKVFMGREALTSVARSGISRRLVGIVMNGKSIPRHQNLVLLKDKVIGEVTTGTYSPSLSRGIAMAYIDNDIEATEAGVDIRGILHSGAVVQLPFIKR
jgi:glycine cleavage system T protein (aminomethyltransferase)